LQLFTAFYDGLYDHETHRHTPTIDPHRVEHSTAVAGFVRLFRIAQERVS